MKDLLSKKAFIWLAIPLLGGIILLITLPLLGCIAQKSRIMSCSALTSQQN